MTARATPSTARRVLWQLRHDPRTIGMLLLVPMVLLALLRGIFDGRPESFDGIGGPLLALFPFTTMFLVLGGHAPGTLDGHSRAPAHHPLRSR